LFQQLLLDLALQLPLLLQSPLQVQLNQSDLVVRLLPLFLVALPVLLDPLPPQVLLDPEFPEHLYFLLHQSVPQALVVLYFLLCQLVRQVRQDQERHSMRYSNLQKFQTH
jgi:hypothetical protein